MKTSNASHSFLLSCATRRLKATLRFAMFAAASTAGSILFDSTAAADVVYLTSLDLGNGHFARYNVATDTWTRLNDYDTNAQMAVSTSGVLYARNALTGFIQRYHPGSDTWSNVMPGPVVIGSEPGNLEITTTGRFLYTQVDNNVIYYADTGGGWNTASIGINHNAMGDYDPTSNQYVLGEYGGESAYLVDVSTFASTAFNNSVDNNGEYARFSSVANNRYYFQYGSIPVHYFDLSNNLAAAQSTGVTLPDSFYNASAADRANNRLFVGSLDGFEFDAMDLASNTLVPLANYIDIGNHSSLAFVPAIPEPAAMILATIGLSALIGQCGRRVRR
jgi:hypothetical protein